MKNRIITFMLICFAAAPLFAAKPKKEGKISKIKPKQTVTLKVLVPAGVDYKDALAEQNDELLSKLNVKLELVTADEKAGAETSDYDFSVCDITLPSYRENCTAGMYLDWEENDLLTKWGPNLKNEKNVGIQKNKFFDSPDRRLHGYGLTLTKTPAPVYEYKSILQLCNDIIKVHYGYLEFGTGYYNPADGSFYEKLSDDGPYLYTLKLLNALHQNEYKFEDANPENFEDLIKHYEENINFHEVSADQAAAENDEGKTEVSESDSNQDEVKSEVTENEVKSETDETELKSQTAESEKTKPAPTPVYYGSNYAWTISSKSTCPELCLAVINQLSLNEIETFSEYPVSLYTTAPYPEDVEKAISKVTKLFEEKSIAAVEAADNDAYTNAVQELKSALEEAGYEACRDFYSAQAQSRFFAEKLSKRTKK